MEAINSKMCELSSTSCIFCAVECSSSYTVINGEVSKLKRESETEHVCILENPGIESTTEEINSIRNNLEVFFILREIFNYPSEKCAPYLSELGGQMHPENWFTVCSTCRTYIQECFRIRRKVTQLEKKLMKIKGTLKQSIFTSTKTKRKRRARSNVNYLPLPDNVWNDLRNHVLQDSSEEKKKRTHFPEEVTTVLDCDPEFYDPDVNNHDFDTNDIGILSPVLPDSMSDSDWTPDSIIDNVKVTRKVDRRVRVQKTTLKQKTNRQNPSIPSLRLKRAKTGKRTKRNHTKNPPEILSRDDSQVDNKVEVTDDKIKEKSPVLNPGCKKRKRVRISKPLRCDECPNKYYTANRLAEHKRLFHIKTASEVGFKCHECDQSFDILFNLIKHLNQKHRKKGEIKKFKWVSTESLGVAKVIHKTEIPYYCDHCEAILPTRNRLITHVNHYHGGKDVACQYCPEKFKSKQLLQFHMEIDHPHVAEVVNVVHPKNEEKPQSCPHCSETFATKLKLDFHIAKYHGNTCPKCSFKAESLQDLQTHLTSKHDIGEKMFICELCSKKFVNMSGLDCHRQVEHYKELGLTPLKCPFCDLVSSKKGSLKAHIRFVHEKVRSHFCEFCGKGFTFSADLQRHILLHTAPREEQYKKGPFFCQICNAKFNVRQGLYYHMKQKHNDTFQLRCDNCGKGYCSSNSLDQHKKSCVK